MENPFIAFLWRGRVNLGLPPCPAPEPFPPAEFKDDPLPPMGPKEHFGFLPRAEMDLRRLHHHADMTPKLARQSQRRRGMNNRGQQLRAEKRILRPKRGKIGKPVPRGYAIVKRHGTQYRPALESEDGVVESGAE